jgi:hypothetical protein
MKAMAHLKRKGDEDEKDVHKIAPRNGDEYDAARRGCRA